MSRFLLLVSFVAASLFAFTTSTLFAGQAPGNGDDKQYKQQELAPYASLAKALKATHTGADTKVSSKSKKSKFKSAHRTSKSKKLVSHKYRSSKKLASHKSSSSKKYFHKKHGSSKSRSYHKSRNYKKSALHKGKKFKKTASNRSGKTR